MSGVDADIWAVVPVKRFERAKQRLAVALRAEERTLLATAMFCDVMGALSQLFELAGIVVVTNDQTAAAIAGRFGAHIVDEPKPDGTNAAVKRGLAYLRDKNVARALIVPSDIPLVRPSDLRRVLGAERRAPLVLVPAVHDGGTNLLLGPTTSLKPCFGPDSFAHHMAAARNDGIEVCVQSLEAIGLDVDDPADLTHVLAQSGMSHTRQLLCRLGEERFVGCRRTTGHANCSEFVAAPLQERPVR